MGVEFCELSRDDDEDRDIDGIPAWWGPTMLMVKAHYEPKILALLNRFRCELQDAGYAVSEVYNMHDEEYRWCFGVDDAIDVSLTIVESACRDGTADGVSFTFDVVADGGEILWEVSPHNWTPDLWVPLDAHHALEERWAMFEKVRGIARAVEGYV